MIDTENKRRSVQAYTFGLLRPVADGVVSVGDRATCTWLYSGLGYAPPVEGGGLNWLKGLSPVGGLSILSGLSPYSGLQKPSR